MKKIMPLVFVAALGACGRSGPPSDLPTVDELAADPARLDQLREQCRLDHAKLGDALCNRVGAATTKRFLGKGTPYTPPKDPPKF